MTRTLHTPQQERRFTEDLQILTGERGDPLDKAVRFRDLASVRNGVVSVQSKTVVLGSTVGGLGSSVAALTARLGVVETDLLGLYDAMPYVRLIIGQSNGRSSAQSTGGDQSVDPMVFLLDNDSLNNAAFVAGTQFLPGAFGTPPLNIGSPGNWSNSMGFASAKSARVRTGRKVYVIQIAAGAHHIESFIKAATLAANGWTLPGSDQVPALSTFMYPGISNALALIPGGPWPITDVLIIQGEANQEDQVESYSAKVVAAMTDLAGEGLINLASTPIAICRLLNSSGNPYRTRHYNACLRAQEDLPTLRIVDSTGLPPAVVNDVHYTGGGLVTMGKRCDAALAAPPVRVDYNTATVLFDVDNGLRFFTAQANVSQGDLANRPAMPLDSKLTIENNATLGWCFRAAANYAPIFTSRRMMPVPAHGIVKVAYEALTTDAGATVDMRVTVYEYTKDRVLIGAKNLTPSNAVMTNAMGRTTYKATFGRNAACDVLFSSNAEFFSYAFFAGQGANDESFAFKINEMSVAPYIINPDGTGPTMIPATGDDVGCSLNGAATNSTLAGAADRCDIYQYPPYRSFTASGMKASVSTALAGATVKLVLYDTDSNGRPGALLGETAAISVAATGIVAGAFAGGNVAIVAGRTYFVGIRHSSTASQDCWPQASVPRINGAANTANRAIFRRASMPYASGATNPWGYSASEATVAAPVALWLTVA